LNSFSAAFNRLSGDRSSLNGPRMQWLQRACVGLCFAMCASAATAQTQTGGAITVDTVWHAVQSPYVVTGDITVDNGAVLTIEPSTVIYMNAGANLIVSNGGLQAKGTASTPIVITAASDIPNGSPLPGSWGQLVFLDNANDANTIVEWAQIRYGSGLRIESASPTLNNLTIQNHAGPAISIDLKSSPAGAGLQASGNTINGISVPAGEITGAVQWKLQGIPYVITEGEVSVGNKPVITGITPAEIQQGQTLDAVIVGTRLAGVESVSFDSAGVTATLGPGATDTAIPLKITATATQPLAAVAFGAQTAAGPVRFETGIAIIPPKPTLIVSGIEPAGMHRGQSLSFQIAGNSLQGAQVTAPAGSGLTLSNLQTTATQAVFNLAASATATLGAQLLTITNPAVANGSATVTLTIANVLPKAYTNPSVLSVLPDASAHSFSVLLTNSDTVAHTINLAVGDPTIATITPASVTIPAGSTAANVTLTGLKLGITSLNFTSATLAAASTQIYVSNITNGAVIGPVTSSPVGVVRPTDLVGTSVEPIISRPVGVVRLTDMSAPPIGTVVGPVFAQPVGVVQPPELSVLPVGTAVGPIISAPVGVTQQ
jgi:hypothetical protein